MKLARYRMVGAISHSPSARQSRVPTTVLAARHMRRSSGGASPHAHHHHHSSQDEAGAVTPGGPGAGPGEEAAPPPRLGMGMPAVAVSQQAGQGPEEVVLFFGIIDFLQVRLVPLMMYCPVVLQSCALARRVARVWWKPGRA